MLFQKGGGGQLLCGSEGGGVTEVNKCDFFWEEVCEDPGTGKYRCSIDLTLLTLNKTEISRDYGHICKYV